MVAIVGASGVGKSTLLHVLGGLDSVDGGRVRIGDDDAAPDCPTPRSSRSATGTSGSCSSSITCCRSSRALENAEMPMRIARRARPERHARARRRCCDASGSSERLAHRPGMLSGGEQQRVAIARALVMEPTLLLADEPTGDLDEHTADTLHELLREMHRERGLTSIIATHNPRLAAACDRVLRLEDGKPQDAPWHGASSRRAQRSGTRSLPAYAKATAVRRSAFASKAERRATSVSVR